MSRHARTTRRFRALAASATLLFLSVSAMPGYCRMSALLTTSDRTPSAHDCCKTGFNSQPPSCCHADMATNVPATLKNAWVSVMLPAETIQGTPAAVATPSAIAAVPTVFSHSPPPTVLRI